MCDYAIFSLIMRSDVARGQLGSSRKYPCPYQGWHFGIPNAWGALWPGFLNARGGGGGCWDWNSECMRGFLILEFRRGGGAKNSDLLTSEVRKTSFICVLAEQTEPQRYDYEVGMCSLFRIAIKRLLSTVVPVVF